MTTFELSPNSRFTISDNPDVLPGKCAVCGSSGGDSRKFVDFGIQLDVYGAVYFCTDCVIELSQAIGFVEQDKVSKLELELKYQSIENERLQKRLTEVENAARTLLRDCNCSNDLDAVLDDPRYGIYAGTSDEKPDDANPEPNESGSVEGSDDVLESPRTNKRARTTKAKS